MSSILGDRIRITRERKGIMQNRLAKAIGISNVQLSRYETGDRNPDPETLKKIADFLDVSVDYLLGRTDERRPPGNVDKSEVATERDDTPPPITRIARAGKKMTPDQAENLEKIARALYPDLFDK